MNLNKLAHVAVLGLILTVAVSGCKKRPTPLTVLPGSRAGAVQEPPPGGMLDPNRSGGFDNTKLTGANVPGGTQGTTGFPMGEGHDGWNRNTEIFKAYTVLFPFDSSAIREGERSKIASVADHLKGNAATAVLVEGHCDERGTEEYNRALGERRATAVREELIRLGIEPTRVDTISYGKDRPADPGHNDDAWRKNRRGEFILLTPPAAP
jgi:peptidoglycan-associated lipoprotein